MEGLTGSARAVPGQGPCTDAQPQHSEADSSTQCVQHGEGPVYSHWTCIASVDMHFLFASRAVPQCVCLENNSGIGTECANRNAKVDGAGGGGS